MKVYCINFQPVVRGQRTNAAVEWFLNLFLQLDPEKYYFLSSQIDGYDGKNMLCMTERQLSLYRLVERITGILRVPKHIKRTLLERIVDYNLCKYLKKETSPFLLITTMYAVRCTKYAKKRGCKTLLRAANLNDNLYYKTVKEEQKRLGMDYTDIYCSNYRIKVYRQMLKNIDYVWCSSRLSAWSFREKNTIVDSRVRQRPRITHPKEYRGVVPDTIKIGYFGHTTLLKGVHLLAEAAVKCNHNDKFEFILAGSVDSNVKSVLDKSEANFTYLGFIEEKDKWDIIRSFDYMVVPSLYDAGPTTIMEALSCDVPVILSSGCGFAERFKDDPKCIEFETMNIKDLAEKLDYAYEHREDYLHPTHIPTAVAEDNLSKDDNRYFTDLIESL